MSQAIAGHGALIAMELDPDGAPGVFTTIAELNGDITEPGYNRPETEVTPHQDDIDSWVTGRLGRDPVTFSVNYIFDDPTHSSLDTAGVGGLQQKIISNKFFGIQFLGPSAGAGPGVDEIIASGFVTNFAATDPVREGARTAEVTMRLSKAQIQDGVQVGQAV